MKSLKSTILMMALLTVNGCAFIGGFFDGDDCKGQDCDTPELLTSPTTKREWYCYGKEDRSGWQCENASDSSRIAAVNPRAISQEPVQEGTPSEKPALVSNKPEESLPTSTGIESILQYPADAYAVQLLALQNEEGVIQYAQQYGITDPLYTRINSQGSEWYVLLLGIYPDRPTAATAKDNWEKNKTLTTRAWIRKLGPLQTAVRAAQG
ncbi:MAG: hypothetical protein CMQ21_14955 [Gammaproteobacteria bacterium]|nr:hypothetical protein [Gammaproteobacteria bacterium]